MSRFFKIPYRSSLLVALMGATLVVAGCKTMEGDTAAADAQNATQVTQRAEQASQVALATKAEVHRHLTATVCPVPHYFLPPNLIF